MIVEKIRHNISIMEKEQLKSSCPRMKKLIQVVDEIESYYIKDSFQALVNAVVYQSISFKAATKIWFRLLDLLVEFTPKEVLNLEYDVIKGVGLSNSKTKYIINIANAFYNNEIRTDFDNMNNDEIMSEIQTIKGIGPWTSEIFLIFSLNRRDVFSWGDIAIRRGLEYLYDLKSPISKKEFDYYKSLYDPNLTVASFYLWEITLRNLFKQMI